MTDTSLPSPNTAADPATEDLPEVPETQHEARLWRDDGWTARVIKNEDDDGWAVAMIKDGEPEPALVGPWTMGRDKKNRLGKIRFVLPRSIGQTELTDLPGEDELPVFCRGRGRAWTLAILKYACGA